MKVIKIFTVGLLASFTLSFIVLWILSGQLISPDRQAIQDYQRDWLDQPSVHGIQITKAFCDKNHVPCLSHLTHNQDQENAVSKYVRN